MHKRDPSWGGRASRILRGLVSLRPHGLERIASGAAGEDRLGPVEVVRAVAAVGEAVSDLRARLPDTAFVAVRDAVRRVSESSWPAAAALAGRVAPLASAGPVDLLAPLADLLHHLGRSDPERARTLAESLPSLLACLDGPAARRQALDAVGRVAMVSPDLAGPFAATLRDLVTDLSPGALRGFVDQGLARVPEGRSRARSFLLRESREGLALYETLRTGLHLDRVARTLQLYAEAHCGTVVRVLPMGALPDGVVPPAGAVSLTDGRDIYLAPRLGTGADDAAHFRLYKLATAHEAGHIEFGTFELDPTRTRSPAGLGVPPPGSWDPALPGDGLRAFVGAFPDADLAAELFMALEDSRIDHRLRHAYPGLAPDLDALLEDERRARPDPRALPPRERVLEVLGRLLWYDDAGVPDAEIPEAVRLVWQGAMALRRPDATVHDAATCAAHAFPLVARLVPARTSAGGRSSAGLPPRPGTPRDRHGGERGAADGGPLAPGAALPHQGAVTLDLSGARREADRRRAERVQGALSDRGIEVPLGEVRRALQGSPDLGDGAVERGLAEEWRDRQRRGRPRPDGRDAEPSAPEQRRGDEAAAGEGRRTFRYPEWDRGIVDYRPEWTTVRERTAPARPGEFVAEVLARYGPLVARLRREFQLIRAWQRGESRGWTEGDELDLDAVVAGVAERRAGHVPDGRYYLRRLRPERGVAVAFLVDLSASTKEGVGRTGRTVIDVEKHALVLMCEALEALGDRYAIYGFSGRGRSHVAFDVFKSFGERYSAEVRDRIAGMTHQMENRDGAAIRHATALLAAEDARVRLLVLLSDGRPLDCGCDQYNDRYAQEDTRMALKEALSARVHPFCITVDRRGEDYLAAMYGDVRYAVIDRVESLPERLPRIYRRLTS